MQAALEATCESGLHFDATHEYAAQAGEDDSRQFGSVRFDVRYAGRNAHAVRYWNDSAAPDWEYLYLDGEHYENYGSGWGPATLEDPIIGYEDYFNACPPEGLSVEREDSRRVDDLGDGHYRWERNYAVDEHWWLSDGLIVRREYRMDWYAGSGRFRASQTYELSGFGETNHLPDPAPR